MTVATNARIAGFTFLFYIVAGVASLILFAQATGGEGIPAKLASIGENERSVRITVVLGLLQSFSALVLAVTLYAITRQQDRDIAMLVLTCRVAEGIGGTSVPGTLGLLWLAGPSGADAARTGAGDALGAFLFKMGGWSPSAIFFAVGSTLMCWLLLRGRMIPAALAWPGLLASALLVVILPLQHSGLLGQVNWLGIVTWLMWLPMLVFEVVLALWLLIKGVASQAPEMGSVLP